MTTALRANRPGVHSISALCTVFADLISVDADEPDPARAAFFDPGLWIDIRKSCLLDRLIYAGEPLRTRRCPIHEGEWSGLWRDEPCPEGCSFGAQLTGWIAEPP